MIMEAHIHSYFCMAKQEVMRIWMYKKVSK